MTRSLHSGHHMNYRDFWIVPLFILLQYLFPILAEKGIPYLLTHFFHYTLQESGRAILFQMMMFLAQVIVIAVFMGLHYADIIPAMKRRLTGVRQHMWRILVVYVVLTVLVFVYQKYVPLMSVSWHILITMALSFVTIGILTPIVEELLFRHLVIGELGKKWGFKFMAVVSILVFAFSHFLHIHSFWTLLPFIAGGVALTYVYMASRRNILVSIILHIIINSVSQILGMLGV
ncbi:TPA: CPBP family intramembrane metalloprotease [Staphylococcus delphini]|uniref:CPBP family intramembrane glutamic endopeptidase n=1 Tax=Staphylococcus delphini TaxID=53344 RepID=UPI000BBCDCBD|nr:CPBP family intramembrane glutamic endopeptidase [Staphylococcus delphini]PCF47778.1 CPBP family intramembrane metalloprotease [Staphylococcus delphini]PCF77326.1 CPBP family intramembrane metalloprotease [Staphylococcus delphini]PCF85566.1 CPBP family intramembrane metalloprotease [Staphylococcus delphini]HEC2155792.1 CPBP family intramembrane metalloprotease [Staphylococcus delphini]HEC2174461.1 CPBP family intramembrane metalloprotease [Staphylococcus delphini]